MKRFAAIVTIAVVVLAMTAGPAMAAVCAGAQCGPAMVCETALSPECPMQSGATMTHSDCGHTSEVVSRDLLPNQPGPESGLVAARLPGAVAPPAAFLSVARLPLTDARGAPHLTSVIRI